MRLLVAEDHPTLARSVANGLREEGFAVDLTFNGDEALHSASSQPYDCLILDIQMPGKTGLQILESLRKKGTKTPVLFLTAADGVDSRVAGLNLGADDYIVKPFAFDELVARVRAVIRRGHGNASGPLVIDDLEIDLPAKTVRRAGKLISLSAREFTLLEYLAQRQGQVVSRTEIWDHTYDENDETVSNVVDVYIGYLRNKIDKGHDRKLIHTRRGMGYMLGVVEEVQSAECKVQSEE